MRYKLFTLLIFIGLANATLITLNDTNSANVGDVYIQQDAGTTNYGNISPMFVASINARRVFLLFNLTAIPAGYRITDANISLYIITNTNPSKDYRIYNTSPIWNETSASRNITWNNQPAENTLQDTRATGTSNGVWMSWNITNAAYTSYKNGENLSLMIRQSDENATASLVYYSAKENSTAGLRPQLYITYEYLCPHNVTIKAYNESNPTQQVYYDLIISNSTTSQTFANVWNWTSENNCNASTPINDITISVSNTSFYSPRYYYTTINSDTNSNISVYLLPTTDAYATSTTFIALSNSMGVTDALITIQKYISSSWVTIAQKKTDASGAASFYLDTATQYYIVTSATGYTTRYDLITPAANTYYLTLTLSSTTTLYWQYKDLITYNCTRTNSSYPTSIDVACHYNDTSNLTTTYRLQLKQIGVAGLVTLCDVSNSTATGNLNCTTGNAGNKTFVYMLTATIGGYELSFEQYVWDFAPAPSFKSYGVFLSILIIGACTLALAFTPSGVIFGATLGVWVSRILLLLDISIEACVAISVVAVILIYELKV